MSTKCPFCDRNEWKDRLILETRRFVVIATKGQVMEGYSLLLPKRHALCFGDLTEDELAEAERLMGRIRAATQSAYSRQPVFYEHGIAGQSVKHAHMHAVPSDRDLLPAIAQVYPHYEPYPPLASLRETFRREGPYLYYESRHGQRYVFHLFRHPQFLRHVLAGANGVPELGDWRNMDPELDAKRIRSTTTKLSEALKP
ncbi:MAG TPA: HIT domain-containing protein [Candidatus Paceibacterota bacterium]|nr:HIT domain-containing protein [Candidatus Paceibacterota bacterium]